jgi:hypothetical protein
MSGQGVAGVLVAILGRAAQPFQGVRAQAAVRPIQRGRVRGERLIGGEAHDVPPAACQLILELAGLEAVTAVEYPGQLDPFGWRVRGVDRADA